jgi:hypothetical protein
VQSTINQWTAFPFVSMSATSRADVAERITGVKVVIVGAAAVEGDSSVVNDISAPRLSPALFLAIS